MAKKPKVEVDEGLVRQVIAGQLPLTTKVTREIEDPAQQEPQAEPDVAARDSEEETQDIPTPGTGAPAATDNGHSGFRADLYDSP